MSDVAFVAELMLRNLWAWLADGCAVAAVDWNNGLHDVTLWSATVLPPRVLELTICRRFVYAGTGSHYQLRPNFKNHYSSWFCSPLNQLNRLIYLLTVLISQS